MNEKNGFVDIELDLIDKNDDNEKIFNMDDIEYLAKSIKQEGFYGAIEVFKKPDGRYEISSGHRRYEAMKFLHRETIPCIVNDMPDDYAVGIKLLSCNIKSRKLTPLDMARSIDYYEKLEKKKGHKGNFTKKASLFFNISESQVYRFQVLLKLIPELQNLANEPNFPYSALRGAVNLSESAQKKLYEQITLFLKVPDPELSPDDEKEYKLSRSRIETIIENLRRTSVSNQAKPHMKKNIELMNESTEPEHELFVPKATVEIKPIQARNFDADVDFEAQFVQRKFGVLLANLGEMSEEDIKRLSKQQREQLQNSLEKLSRILKNMQ